MLGTLLLSAVVANLGTKDQVKISYPKDPRQNLAVVTRPGRQATRPATAIAYAKDIKANLAQPATGTTAASQRFKPKGSYPKDPRNNLASP